MTAKPKRTIAVRITEEQYQELEKLAQRRYWPVATLVRVLVEKLLEGELKLNGNGNAGK